MSDAIGYAIGYVNALVLVGAALGVTLAWCIERIGRLKKKLASLEYLVAERQQLIEKLYEVIAADEELIREQAVELSHLPKKGPHGFVKREKPANLDIKAPHCTPASPPPIRRG